MKLQLEGLVAVNVFSPCKNSCRLVSSLSLQQMHGLLLYQLSVWAIQCGRIEPSGQWQQQTPAGIPRRAGYLFSVVVGMLPPGGVHSSDSEARK